MAPRTLDGREALGQSWITGRLAITTDNRNVLGEEMSGPLGMLAARFQYKSHGPIDVCLIARLLCP
jgi:hypothetical protein